MCIILTVLTYSCMQIKSVVMRDIKAIGAARAIGMSKDTGKSYSIDPAVASAAARLVNRVFESCSQVKPSSSFEPSQKGLRSSDSASNALYPLRRASNVLYVKLYHSLFF